MTEGHIYILISILAGFATILGFLLKIMLVIRKVEKKLDYLIVEHELLVMDYCERKGIPLTALPTRTGGFKT